MNPRAALTILVRFSRTVTFQLHHIFRHSATARHNRYLLLSLGLLVTVTLSAQQLFHHQEEFARSRLFETSAQDLLLQSMVLRHLQTDNSQIGQIRIASQGYKSTAELLHQVSSRLAILEASSPNANLSKILLDLRIQWVLMKTRLKSHPELPVQFSHNWWKALEDLNRQASAAKRDSGQAVINLQRYSQGLLILVMTSLTLASIYFTWKIRLHHASLNTTKRPASLDRDELTGFLNSRGWQKQAHRHLNRANHHAIGSLAILKINHFQQYQSTYGQSDAEQRLLKFSALLRANSRPGDLIARTGEAEFALLLPNCRPDQAMGWLKRVKESDLQGIEISAGVCGLELKHNLSYAMALADQAMGLSNLK